MENEYKIVKRNGDIIDAESYLKSPNHQNDFSVFVEREALGKSAQADGAKSDYLSYAQKLGFDWEANADAGFAQYDYKANLIMRLVKDYARMLVHDIGFPIYEVSGSNAFDMSHPVVEAYAKLYGDRLFQFESGKKKIVMSYDASYPQFNLASKAAINHRHLPFAHFSIADCYRYEQSGECMLLHRQRRFYMPDLHPYFKDVAEAFAWYPKIERQLLGAAKEIGVDYHIVIEVSSAEHWENYRAQILEIAKRLDRDVLICIIRDGKDRYWIVNVDYKIIDRLGQSREIGCIQIDIGNAKRLGIEYLDENGKMANPVIIHSAVPGGIERYIYMLLDRFKERFPLWLYPAQIRLIPVNENMVAFCEQIAAQYRHLPVRIEIDDRSASVGKKVKLAHDDLIPFPVVIGEKEMAASESIPELMAAIEKIVANAHGKPFIPMEYPSLVSLQIR